MQKGKRYATDLMGQTTRGNTKIRKKEKSQTVQLGFGCAEMVGQHRN